MPPLSLQSCELYNIEWLIRHSCDSISLDFVCVCFLDLSQFFGPQRIRISIGALHTLSLVSSVMYVLCQCGLLNATPIYIQVSIVYMRHHISSAPICCMSVITLDLFIVQVIRCLFVVSSYICCYCVFSYLWCLNHV